MVGMYVLGVAFIIFIIALILVQASVRYTIKASSLDILPKDELISLEKGKLTYVIDDEDGATIVNEKGLKELTPGQTRTLFVYEQGEATSDKAQDLFIPVLNQMKEPFDVIEAINFESKMLVSYDKVILAVTHYPKLADVLPSLKDWVKNGGNLLIAYPPEVTGSYRVLYDILGVKDSGTSVVVEGLHFCKPFMIGSTQQDYPILDPYDCSLGLSLNDECEVYIESTGEHPVPILWRRKIGEGSTVVDNFSILDKAYRGIHCSAYSLLGDYCVYPVINGAAFYIDDFPSPVPEGDATYITRDYNIPISDFYSQVWWNDIYDLGDRYKIPFTGLVIENYSNQVEGEFERNPEISRFQYFGNMLLQAGGEIGIHGYNHMPLVLENFDYKDQYDSYIQWPSKDDIRNSLDEVFAFTKSLFENSKLEVYVPPSNVLSKEGREVLDETSIRTIASVYLPTDLAYEQEFDISEEDGIINTPRITSGCVIDDYMYIAALSELNFHFVSTHFLHPDDVLDEDRGAELGWEKLYRNLQDYISWLYKSCPVIRRATGSELAAAVQRYDLVKPLRTYNGNTIELKLDNFYSEAWMILRLNDEQTIDEIDGGSFEEVAEGMYLVKCDEESVTIHLR